MLFGITCTTRSLAIYDRKGVYADDYLHDWLNCSAYSNTVIKAQLFILPVCND